MSLRDALEKDGLIIAPGVYDALSGLIASQSGAQALYLSGASLAYTRFGTSDIGLISVSEVNDTIAAITDRINIPIIVDADTGFGNALSVQARMRFNLKISLFQRNVAIWMGKNWSQRKRWLGKFRLRLTPVPVRRR